MGLVDEVARSYGEELRTVFELCLRRAKTVRILNLKYPAFCAICRLAQ